MLQTINLSRNSIRSIPDSIHAWVEAHDVIIDLSRNPLACHCGNDVIKTITWLHKHKNKYHGFAEYSCYGFHENRHGSTLIADINTDDYLDKCDHWESDEITLLVASAVLVTIAVGVATLLLHKYRYRVIMQLYRIKRAFVERNKENNSYEYEVFLSSCSEDSPWVQNILAPYLEGVHGIKCCIHEREFPITGRLSRVICEFMEQSRYILVVISRHSIHDAELHDTIRIKDEARLL